jgi:hypothetical protein
MDLALELGMTVAQLKTSMLARELHAWEVYAARKMLPARRRDVYLAQVAQAMAGGKLVDWLLDPSDEPPPLTSNEGAMALDTIAGGIGVRKLGQGRKKKEGS